jgi:hypothetical protein
LFGGLPRPRLIERSTAFSSMYAMTAIPKPTNHRSIRRKKGRLETLLTMSFLKKQV